MGPSSTTIAKATEDLAKGMGRSEGKKRVPPSTLLRGAMAEDTVKVPVGEERWRFDGKAYERIEGKKAPLPKVLHKLWGW